MLRAAADLIAPGKAPSTPGTSATPADGFQIAKFVDEQRRVFGFANVSIAKDGEQITDLQGHLIDPHELEEAAYEFVKLEFAGAGEMHEGGAVGQLIESMVLDTEKARIILSAAGVAADVVGQVDVPPRWWVGFELSEESFAKVKTGEFRMFSVQGTAQLEEVA